MIPAMTTLFLALGSLLFLLGPVAALVVLCRRRRCGGWPALAGALAFLAAYGLQSRAVGALLGVPRLGGLLTASAARYAVFFALVSGVFEESARLAVLGPMRRRRGWDGNAAVAYAIGHGGVEAMIAVGIPYAASLAFAVCAAAYGPDSAAALFRVSAASVEALVAPPSLHYLAALVERLSALALHAANTSLIWLALRRGMAWLYPAAIATHALVNLGVAFYQYGATTSIWGVECYTAVMAAAVCVFARQMWRRAG